MGAVFGSGPAGRMGTKEKGGENRKGGPGAHSGTVIWTDQGGSGDEWQGVMRGGGRRQRLSERLSKRLSERLSEQSHMKPR